MSRGAFCFRGDDVVGVLVCGDIVMAGMGYGGNGIWLFF